MWRVSHYIVISGLGGTLISNIIEENINKIKDQKLILQANRNNYDLRKYLSSNNFKFLDEDIIYDGFYYQIIVVKKDKEKNTLTDSKLHYGPINIQKKKEILYEMLKKEEERLIKIPDSNHFKRKKIEIIRSILYEN